jgi:tRNA(fMet)-specific endonuclease VapC
MKKYLLDTNICIHFLKGEYNLNRKIEEVGFENCYVSEITILELLFGVANSADSKKEKNKEIVEKFKEYLEGRVVPIHTCFEIYAREKVRLKQLGRLIAEFDLLIGCSAIANNMVIVTRNVKHFEHIENIEIENWINTTH